MHNKNYLTLKTHQIAPEIDLTKAKITLNFADDSSLFPRKLLKYVCALAGLLTYSRG